MSLWILDLKSRKDRERILFSSPKTTSAKFKTQEVLKLLSTEYGGSFAYVAFDKCFL